MPAYRLTEWGEHPRVADATIPRPGPGQLVVRVAANGLCHSDLSMAEMPGSIGDAMGWQLPFTLGHEIAGWVEMLGEGIDTIAVGAAVALVSPHSCGHCRVCLAGRDSLCEEGIVGRGYGRDGGLAPYVLVESTRDVLALGALDPISSAPLTDAGATSLHAVRRVLPRIEGDDWVVVIGAGGVGGFAIQFLRALSDARVVAVDVSSDRLEVARSLGATETVVGGDGSGGRLRELVGSDGAAAVLDVVGLDDTIRTGLSLVRPGGAFGLVGAGGGTLRRPWWGTLPRDAEIFTFQGSDIDDGREAIRLAGEGRVRSEVDVFPFDQIEEAYAAMEAGTLRGRAVVTPPD